MASRRIATSAALRALSARSITAAARPALIRSATALRAPFLAQRAAIFAVDVAHRDIGRRWYSTDDNAVSGGRIWEFQEIKKIADDEKSKVVIVDVREPVELFETGKIPGAINIPITSAVQSFHIPEEDFEDMYGFERPPKDAELLFYCKAGVRARTAAHLAKHAGWNNVGEYPGSWLDWEKNRGPVELVTKPGHGLE